jgi:hypothetical protein
MLDYAVISPRLRYRYDWSAEELGHPGLSELIHEGSPAYVRPHSERDVWDTPPMPIGAAALRRATTSQACWHDRP